MNIQSYAHNYFPKAVQPGFRQNLQRRRGLELPGGILLWSAVAKVFLVITPLLLAANLWFTSEMGLVETAIQAEQQALFRVNNENIVVRTEKARLLSPEHVQIVAAEKLALMVPGPEQIQRM